MRKNNSWLVAIFAIAIAQEVSALDASADTAKWLLYDFRRPAANNAEFEKYHLGATYDNHETICPDASIRVATNSVGTEHFARIVATRSARLWRSDLRTCAGILFPIDPWWTSNNDLRGIKELRFKSKGISDVDVALDGLATPAAIGGFQPILSVWNDVADKWTWTVIKFPNEDFEFPAWGNSCVSVYKRDSLGHVGLDSCIGIPRNNSRKRLLNSELSGSADYDSDSFNILKNIRAIKFQLGNYDYDFQIDSIMLVGVSPTWPRVNGKSCQGVSALLDDFSATKSAPSLRQDVVFSH